MIKYQVREFAVKQYVTDSSRIAMKTPTFRDVTCRRIITHYDNSKRRKLLAKRHGVTFNRMLASHTDLTVAV
jgi:hypothetical protein